MRKYLFLICTLFIPLMLCGAVSANVNSLNENTKASSSISSADLIVTKLYTPSTGVKGKNISVSGTVKNQGNKGANGFWVSYFLKNSVNSKTYHIGQIYTTSLSAGASKSINTKVTIPTSISSGNYLLKIYADSSKKIAESNENNNYRYSSNKISITNPKKPDLTVKINQVVNGFGSDHIYFTVKNNGSATSGSCKLLLDSSFIYKGTKHINVVTVNIPSLAPGKTYFSVGYLQCELNDNAWLGVLAIIDSAKQVIESNESNNKFDMRKTYSDITWIDGSIYLPS